MNQNYLVNANMRYRQRRGVRFYLPMQGTAITYHEYFFEKFYLTHTLRHKKLQKVCKAFLLANITRELFPALEMNFFNFKMKKKSGKQFYAFNVFVTTVLWQKFKKISALREFYEMTLDLKVDLRNLRFHKKQEYGPKKMTFHLFFRSQIIRSKF